MAQSTLYNVRRSLLTAGGVVVFIWLVHLVQFVFRFHLGGLGIRPRTVDGLKGILFSPLIHSHSPKVYFHSSFDALLHDFGHILSNTPPLFVLLAMILIFYRRIAPGSLALLYLLTGIAVWLFARGNTYHIGASGVIYAMVSFVFWNGIFRFNPKSIALALVVAFYYGGMFMGVLPGEEHISWESHLFGGLVGILVSYFYRDQLEVGEKPQYSWENEATLPRRNFLAQDTFDRTREERARDQASDYWSNHTGQ